MLFGAPWDRPFPPYLVKYLQPVVFFFFSLFSSCPLLVRLHALRDVVLFRLRGGGMVIGTGTGRGSGDCVDFLFLYVFVVPFVVRGLICLRLWRRVRFPRRSLIGIMGAPDVAATAIVAWSSPD